MVLACSIVLRRIEVAVITGILKIIDLTIVAAPILLLSSFNLVLAQGYPAIQDSESIPSGFMTFFVTSEPIGDGGNLGGLEGADTHCQNLATAVGHGDKTWRAYLSTQARPGLPAINARDRIGVGPWFPPKERLLDYLNRRISRPLVKSQIHGDTLLEAQRGSNMSKEFAINEYGERINGIGDPQPLLHDMLTGSQTDGRAYEDEADHTCNNWTSNEQGSAQVGHSDRIGHGNTSWNSSHATLGCSQEDLANSGGSGLFYCFAVD